MVTVIIGILGAFALSAYSDYTVRARVAEALSFVGEAKAIVVENAVSGHHDLASGFTASAISTKVIQRVSVDPFLGDITVEFTAIVEAGSSLVFQPLAEGLPLQIGRVPGEAIAWRCDTVRSTLSVRYRPPDCK